MTSWQAGMAVPDWPLSFGSLNPEGWWGKFEVRLEHGHRLLAAFVGLCVGILCAAIWGNWRALGVAAGVSFVASTVAKKLGAEPSLLAHIGVWPAAVAFLTVLRRWQSSPSEIGFIERRLAASAFILVCLQATLGGLRVTRETAGFIDVAIVLRVLHGCVAQAFLVVLVALAVRTGLLASRTQAAETSVSPRYRKFAWIALVAVYSQLIVGASMRHLGAGLAIPTFPAASADGGWMPKIHNLPTDLNFLHTRMGALLVTVCVLFSAILLIKNVSSSRTLRNAGIRSLVLVFVQVCLGILVIWHLKPPTLATLHVVVGAMLLANLAATLVHVLNSEERVGQGGRQ